MKKGDELHKRLLKLARENADHCAVCYRHAAGSSRFHNLNPNNLLQHMASAHGFSTLRKRRWWQFWKH